MEYPFQVRLRVIAYAGNMSRPTLILLMTFVAACNNEIFVRDGVTDGDTFFLAERAYSDSDPVLQSWVTYSLAKSTCQLELGGDNPARASSYGCEFTARKLMLQTWTEKQRQNSQVSDDYLDELRLIQQAGYLDEYVVHYFGRKAWQVPAEVDSKKFRLWRREHLRGHKRQTRIIGSWNYAKPDRTMTDGEH